MMQGGLQMESRRLVISAMLVGAAIAAMPIGKLSRAAGIAADEFIASLGNRVIGVVTDSRADQAAREQFYRDMFRSAFAMEEIARFVLGRHWRSATSDQKERFVRAVEDYAVKVYGSRFSQYSGERFIVRDSRPMGDHGDQVVSTLIERPGNGPPVRLDWRVREHGAGWRIVDVLVEGVSMTITQRQEYGSVLQQSNGNLDVLIEKIRAKAN